MISFTSLQNRTGVSKNIGTLINRFLHFLKKQLLLTPAPPNKTVYGNCQERTYIFKRKSIPSFPFSRVYVPLGVTTTHKELEKKGSKKDVLNKIDIFFYFFLFFLSLHHLNNFLYAHPVSLPVKDIKNL